MGELIYQWIDLVWLPVGWLAVHKNHRIQTAAFILTCIFTLRLQVELIELTGYDTGFLPFMDSAVYTRGLVVYGVIIALFLILAHFSPKTRSIVFFAAALSIYFFAFCVSMVIMVL